MIESSYDHDAALESTRSLRLSTGRGRRQPIPLPYWLISLLSFFALFACLRYLASSFFSKPPLALSRDNTFHVAVFADLHYGENESTFGIAADRKSTALMRQVLSQEQPDFVVLNGDLITGENTFAFNSTKYVDEIVAPLVEGGYSWASTYGNHDSKYNLSREALYTEEKAYTGCYTGRGPTGSDGVTNYVLPIFPFGSARSTQKPIALLWFFDSRGGAEYKHLPANLDNIPNFVSNGTVAWFRSTQADLQVRYGLHFRLWNMPHAKQWKSGLRRCNVAQLTRTQMKYGTLPSLAFVHIPFQAFLQLQTQSSPKVSSSHYPGLNADIPLAQQGYSDTGAESVPFMEALLDTPGLHSIYTGHDHGDSWCGRWPISPLSGYDTGGGRSQERPILCFCKHSGYGGYGTWNRGVRQIRMIFDQDGAMSVQTWVRMQSRNIVTSVSLNETYGEDVYPTADGE